MSQKVKVQCISMNRNNTRCKHYTVRGELCHQHLEQKGRLKIRPSKIVGAAQGLYTTKPIEEGQFIAPYTGDHIATNRPNYAGGPYVLKVKNNPTKTFIDAKKTNTGEARYVNDCKPNDANCSINAEFVYNHRTKKAGVKATKDIPADAEVYAKYGPNYWGKRKKYITAKQTNIGAVPVVPPRQPVVAPAAPVRRGPSAKLTELRNKLKKYQKDMSDYLRRYREAYAVAVARKPSDIPLLQQKHRTDMPKFKNKIQSLKQQIARQFALERPQNQN